MSFSADIDQQKSCQTCFWLKSYENRCRSECDKSTEDIFFQNILANFLEERPKPSPRLSLSNQTRHSVSKGDEYSNTARRITQSPEKLLTAEDYSLLGAATVQVKINDSPDFEYLWTENGLLFSNRIARKSTKAESIKISDIVRVVRFADAETRKLDVFVQQPNGPVCVERIEFLKQREMEVFYQAIKEKFNSSSKADVTEKQDEKQRLSRTPSKVFNAEPDECPKRETPLGYSKDGNAVLSRFLCDAVSP